MQLLLEGCQFRRVGLSFLQLPAVLSRSNHGVEHRWEGQGRTALACAETAVRIVFALQHTCSV